MAGKPTTKNGQARSERINLRTTPAAAEVIRSVLKEGETLSQFARTAIEREVGRRQVR